MSMLNIFLPIMYFVLHFFVHTYRGSYFYTERLEVASRKFPLLTVSLSRDCLTEKHEVHLVCKISKYA